MESPSNKQDKRLETKFAEYFEPWEFERSQTASRYGIDNTMTELVKANCEILIANVLDPLREIVKAPININSGYRSFALNQRIGGNPKSHHCKGMAADIECFTLTNYQLAKLIEYNFSFTQLILEFYKSGDPRSGWVHIAYDKDDLRNEVFTFDGKTYTEGLIA